jgi:anaerobic ribonucleoside-triphosphate reductase activating protein
MSGAWGAEIGVHLLHYPIYTLGPGRRIGLWLQGCSIHCEGCISRDTWNFGGERMAVDELAKEITDVFGGGGFDGLTVSGGEPFDQSAALMFFLREINASGINDVLIYSGYKIESLLGRFGEIKDIAAAVVDGPFALGDESESCWRGSANQTMTLFRPELRERYALWSRGKKGRLQVLRDERGLFIAGIPRQKDVSKIKSLG